MKKYKNTDELKKSKHFVTCTFREGFSIGDIVFEVYIYLVDAVDDERFLFGCFYNNQTVSPVFDTYNDCLKYSIHIFNQSEYDRVHEREAEVKKFIKGGLRGCAKQTAIPIEPCCGGLNGKDHVGASAKNSKRGKQL